MIQGIVYAIICLVLGIVGFIAWWGDFVHLLKGILPLGLIVAGLLLLSTNISMIRESSADSVDGEDEGGDKQ